MIKKTYLFKWVTSLILVLALLVTIGAPTKVSCAESKYLIRVNRKMCVATVYERDNKGDYTVPVRAMLCSPGWDTPLGTFYTPAKYRWKLLQDNVWGQYSTRITDGILFHSVWYYEQKPSTLSVRQFNKLGTICSHGCVRMNVQDVKWIYDNCELGTKVIIYDSNNPGPLGKPAAIRIQDTSRMSYDPTDVWSKDNPYNKKKPAIYGVKDKTIAYGAKVNLMKGVTGKASYGEDISSMVTWSVTYKGKGVKRVNSKKAGKYQVTYKVTDLLKRTAEKTITVKVTDEEKAELSCKSIIYTNQENIKSVLKENVTCYWHDEDISRKVKYTIEPEEEGEGYTVNRVLLKVTTDNGVTVKKTVQVVVDLQKPVLEGIPEERELSADQLNPDTLLQGVLVTDNYDDLSLKDVQVTLTKLDDGSVEALYQVTDRCQNLTEAKTIIHIINEEKTPAIGWSLFSCS